MLQAQIGEGASPELDVVRLHVGGLGESVMSSDLRQTFSSLVHVSAVDVVRTKGRSFAYVTVQATPHDIKRLFSLYNGCLWKGGRLKLEKAREFYMDKLQQEWAERAQLEAHNTPKANAVTLKGKVLCHKEARGIKIYFPKLRKVKTIPAKGAGKHKRSFESVEPLPHSLLRICNCDEDCLAACSNQTPSGQSEVSIKVDQNLIFSSSFPKSEADQKEILHKRKIDLEAKELVQKGVINNNRSNLDGLDDENKEFPESKPQRNAGKSIHSQNEDSKVDQAANLRKRSKQDKNSTIDGESPKVAESCKESMHMENAEKWDEGSEHDFDADGLVLNIKSGSSNAADHNYEVEPTITSDRSLVNNTKFSYQNREHLKLAARAMMGIPTSQGKIQNIDQNDKNRQGSVNNEGKGRAQYGGEMKESMQGRDWVQKASWKSLLGAKRMSFSLGSIVDPNNEQKI
ncbi:hypothetical protein KP509_16G025100 [Ceratopteris richardii]|uniref:RRM domain-containing protein n=1 Tax=Ceratopteris richardii TaxID=49495 RepID=A0A8T2T0G1_CERRI|nr:hypothetical protein KP509_16G025100 [Ceratopteris richardii]